MHAAGLLFSLSALVASVSASMVEQETPCPTMPPMPTEEPEACQVLKNMDRPGFDLKAVKGPLDSCAIACEDTKKCRTWAWSHYEGGTCWLKTHGSELVPKGGVWTTDCEVDGPTKPAPTTKPTETTKPSPTTKPTQTTKPTTAPPTAECKPLKNIDFEGNDIASKPAKNFGQCCGICSAYSGCKAYAWSDFNGGTCWLKAGVTTVIRKEGVVSASVVPLGEAVCPFEFDTDFVGNDTESHRAKNAGECCAICKHHKECKAFSWSNYQGGTCWMKSGKGKAIRAVGVISAKLTDF